MVDYQDFLKSAEQLLHKGDEMGYRIANRLNNLRKRRNTADYELHKTLPYYDAISAIKMAQNAIQELNQLQQ